MQINLKISIDFILAKKKKKQKINIKNYQNQYQKIKNQKLIPDSPFKIKKKKKKDN